MSDTKLNVCLANDSFPPTIDGVANAVFNYANIINSELGRVIVATPRYPNVKDDYDFPVVRYHSIDTTKQLGYRTGNPVAPAAISKISSFHPDIIHSHCPMVSTFLSRSLRDINNVPIVFTYHTKFDIDIKNAIKSNFIQDQAVKLLVQNIATCDDVWVVSRGAGENLKSLGYSGEYTVMENGVDFPKGRVSQDEIIKVKARHSIDHDSTVFIFVGRMMWYKGIRIILDGLKTLSDRKIKFRMIFVGDGADRDEIEAYAKQLNIFEECIFTGAIHERDNLRAYYCSADLFLFPSTFDTNGIVVREAAACGLPSVLVRGSCASEGITDGVSGLLIDENAESLAAALSDACKHKDKLKQIGVFASENIYVSWEDSVKRAYERYFTVIDAYSHGKRKEKLISRADFYSAIPELKAGIEKARQNRLELESTLKKRYDKFIDLVDRYL